MMKLAVEDALNYASHVFNLLEISSRIVVLGSLMDDVGKRPSFHIK